MVDNWFLSEEIVLLALKEVMVYLLFEGQPLGSTNLYSSHLAVILAKVIRHLLASPTRRGGPWHADKLLPGKEDVHSKKYQQLRASPGESSW